MRKDIAEEVRAQRPFPYVEISLNFLQITAAAKKSSNVYKNSYVFLTVRNTKTGDEQRICGNYQQYKSRAIATGPDQPDAVICLFEI